MESLLFHALLKQMDSFEAQDGEYHRGCVDCSESIADRNDDDVLEKRKITLRPANIRYTLTQFLLGAL